jgi:lysophospholipase-2
MASERNIKTPFFAAHGTADEVVPYAFGNASYEMVKAKGYNIKFHSYSGLGHSADQREMSDLADFLQDCLPKL